LADGNAPTYHRQSKWALVSGKGTEADVKMLLQRLVAYAMHTSFYHRKEHPRGYQWWLLPSYTLPFCLINIAVFSNLNIDHECRTPLYTDMTVVMAIAVWESNNIAICVGVPLTGILFSSWAICDWWNRPGTFEHFRFVPGSSGFPLLRCNDFTLRMCLNAHFVAPAHAHVAFNDDDRPNRVHCCNNLCIFFSSFHNFWTTSGFPVKI